MKQALFTLSEAPHAGRRSRGLLALVLGLGRRRPSRVAAQRSNTFTGRMRDRTGHVAVEVGLSFPLVFVVMVGTFTFGQTLFTYNMLVSSMRSAARYASLAPYDLPNGTDWKARVKNMAVFGDPDPAPGSIPLAHGLKLEHVSVTPLLVNGEPQRVTVAVQNLDIHNLFQDVTTSKPVVVFPYLGRVLVP